MISICIPCYEMHGKGDLYLTYLLDSIVIQKFNLYEVVVSDQSSSNMIENVAYNYSSKIDLTYCKCDKPGKSSYNLNNAISKAKYGIIKPMFQDDFFINNNCLSLIAEQNTTPFGGCGFTHFDENNVHIGNTMLPKYNENIKNGINTIGSPSTVFFKNDDNYFNNDLVWLMDCEFYERLMRKYNYLTTISDISIGIRIWRNSYTNHISSQIKNQEQLIVNKIHA